MGGDAPCVTAQPGQVLGGGKGKCKIPHLGETQGPGLRAQRGPAGPRRLSLSRRAPTTARGSSRGAPDPLRDTLMLEFREHPSHVNPFCVTNSVFTGLKKKRTHFIPRNTK